MKGGAGGGPDGETRESETFEEIEKKVTIAVQFIHGGSHRDVRADLHDSLYSLRGFVEGPGAAFQRP